MYAEQNTNKKARMPTCGWCDGITEMMMGCFPDDAGYSACLAGMKKMRDNFCNPEADGSASEDKQGGRD